MPVFPLTHANSRRIACRQVMQAPEGYEAEIREPKRTADQNDAQWPLLQCFADQLQWPVNGLMTYMDRYEWKDVLSAAFRKETVRLAMGLDGGVVMLGKRTSKFKKAEFSDYLEFLHMVAAQRGVNIERVAA